MQNKLDTLLNYLCAQWGFCIPQSEKERIKALNGIDADLFACEVLKAEGMNPDLESEWRRKINNKFKESFGG